MWECFLFLSCGDPWKEHFLALEQFWTCTAPCPDHWERTQRGQQTNLVITLRGWSRLMTASSMFLPPDWTTFEGRKEHQTPHPPRPGWVPCEPEPRTAVQGEGWTWGAPVARWYGPVGYLHSSILGQLDSGPCQLLAACPITKAWHLGPSLALSCNPPLPLWLHPQHLQGLDKVLRPHSSHPLFPVLLILTRAIAWASESLNSRPT